MRCHNRMPMEAEEKITYAPTLPKPGETLHGNKFVMGYGGKGANQCVAATKLGASTALIARLGDDSFGLEYKNTLQKQNINTDHVSITHGGISSGMAGICVAENGENNIVIVAGANNMLSVSDINHASSVIREACVLIFQFETPVATTIHTLKMKRNGIAIVNGAPANVEVDPEVFQLPEIFCVNETEAGAMTNMTITTVSEAGIAVNKLLDKGCQSVILTLGKEGTVYASKENCSPIHIPSKVVAPVDTTGAGDMFIGALGYYLAYHPDLGMVESIRRSNEIAAVSVQSIGTQTSFPKREQLREELFSSV